MKYILGLTGQTGAGKSTAQSVAQKAGFYIIDCDNVARETVKPGSPALKALTDEFGKEILTETNELNRKKLAQIAFSSCENTEKLNSVLLPFILKNIEEIITNCKNDKILLDAPTLFESGADKLCTKKIGVTAPLNLRMKRIIERDNLTEAEALSRINAGKSDEFFKENCDAVIENSGEKNEFINNFENLLKNILGGNNNG